MRLTPVPSELLERWIAHIDVVSGRVTQEVVDSDTAKGSRNGVAKVTPVIVDAASADAKRARERGDDARAEAAAIDLDARDMSGAGSTALLQAAYFGRTAVVEALLEAGADPTLLDVDGKSPADWAASEGHAELAKILRRAASGD